MDDSDAQMGAIAPARNAQPVGVRLPRRLQRR